jgi:hypothetical protein
MTHTILAPLALRKLALVLPFILLSTACGGKDAEDGGAGAPAASAAPDAGGTEGERAATFTEADLDAYKRGFAREIELVREAQERARTATTPQARAEAAQAGWETATIPGGAEAAGMPLERYREIRETVHHVMQTLDFQGKIDGPMSMDTTNAPPEMRRRLTSDAYEGLPASSAAALRARMDGLVPLWSEYINLVAVAG